RLHGGAVADFEHVHAGVRASGTVMAQQIEVKVNLRRVRWAGYLMRPTLAIVAWLLNTTARAFPVWARPHFTIEYTIGERA
ncbi:MAG: hypothetical protein ACEQSX_15545, partial [Baekduiaceae bacterium]